MSANPNQQLSEEDLNIENEVQQLEKARKTLYGSLESLLIMMALTPECIRADLRIMEQRIRCTINKIDAMFTNPEHDDLYTSDETSAWYDEEEIERLTRVITTTQNRIDRYAADIEYRDDWERIGDDIDKAAARKRLYIKHLQAVENHIMDNPKANWLPF